jgi:hypothetical protein
MDDRSNLQLPLHQRRLRILDEGPDGDDDTQMQLSINDHSIVLLLYYLRCFNPCPFHLAPDFPGH